MKDTLTFKGQASLVRIRCRGCGSAMGWGTGQPLVRVFCSPACAYDGPLGKNEERNGLIMEAVAAGWTTHKAAENWSLTHQRIQQLIDRERTTALVGRR